MNYFHRGIGRFTMQQENNKKDAYRNAVEKERLGMAEWVKMVTPKIKKQEKQVNIAEWIKMVIKEGEKPKEEYRIAVEKDRLEIAEWIKLVTPK